jgi:hypothetical protein
MDDRAIIRSFEKGWGPRAGFLAFAVFVVGALIAFLIVGFHNRHISQNAAALTAAPAVTTPATPRPSQTTAH